MPNFSTYMRTRPVKKGANKPAATSTGRYGRLARATRSPIGDAAREIHAADPETRRQLIDKHRAAALENPEQARFYRVLRNLLQAKYDIEAPALPAQPA